MAQKTEFFSDETEALSLQHTHTSNSQAKLTTASTATDWKPY